MKLGLLIATMIVLAGMLGIAEEPAVVDDPVPTATTSTATISVGEPSSFRLVSELRAMESPLPTPAP